MKDARRYKRFAVDLMKITGRMFANEVEIVDISTDSVSLKADMRLDIGSEYRLRLEDEEDVVLVKGSIESSSITTPKKDPEGNTVLIYAAEMKFAGVSRNERAKLERFIEAFRRQEHIGLGSVRVHVPGGKTALDLSADYRVKKLSLGGMLIDNRHALKVNGKVPMEMTLPGGHTIRFLGRVASCLKTKDDRHDIGIEFLDMSDTNKEHLKNLLELLDSADADPSKASLTDDVWSRLGNREQDRK